MPTEKKLGIKKRVRRQPDFRIRNPGLVPKAKQVLKTAKKAVKKVVTKVKKKLMKKGK